jgi:D-glycero-D-manno-heptose 1,7-bisphosphate phosphatase
MSDRPPLHDEDLGGPGFRDRKKLAQQMNQPQKTIFLDRDGTLNEDVGYLWRLEDLQIFPFVKEALSIFKSKAYRLVVVTNQSGIGRGIYDENAMHAIHKQMQIELDNAIDAFYFCPHLPEFDCSCRKPRTGMIECAMKEFEIDISNSWIVGDKKLDIETGRDLGLRSALVSTGYGSSHRSLLEFEPDVVAEDLLHAARQIVSLD